MDAVILILSDARGMYIPRDFLTDDLGNIAEDHCAAWGLTTENSEWWQDAVDPCSRHTLRYWQGVPVNILTQKGIIMRHTGWFRCSKTGRVYRK